MAARMAYPITSSASMVQATETRLELLMRKARASNGQEDTTETLGKTGSAWPVAAGTGHVRGADGSRHLPANQLHSGRTVAAHVRARDVSRYASGVKSMFNCYPVVQGGAINKPCTRYMGEVEDSANITRLIPFVYSEEISYVLEFGDQVMRVWTVDGQVEVTGTPYQITTPYTSAQLADLDFTQNGATMVLFPLTLRRIGWTGSRTTVGP